MKTYQRYGNEWEREVMKNPKAVIVGMLRGVAQERDKNRNAIEQALRELRSTQRNWDEDCLFNANNILEYALKGETK